MGRGRRSSFLVDSAALRRLHGIPLSLLQSQTSPHVHGVDLEANGELREALSWFVERRRS